MRVSIARVALTTVAALATGLAFAAKPVKPTPITAVNAGPGLQGGGTSGDVTLSLQSCAAGQVLVWDGVSAWQCMTGGDITSVSAGSGLIGGGNSGAVMLSLPNCAAGEVLQSTGTGWACASPPTPSSSGVIAYSGGQPIGSVLYGGRDSNSIFGLLSDADYLFEIEMDNGMLRAPDKLYFAGLSCTGNAYSATATWKAQQGFVFGASSPHPVRIYYIARGTELQWITFQSELIGDNCSNWSNEGSLYLALPNDPDVTGVSSNPVALPITFGTP